MPRFLHVAAAIAVAVSSPAAPQSSPANDLTGAVQLAVNRGELLYIYDRAAWQGTDDFLANFPNLMSDTGGFIVSGDENQTELAFYDKAKTRALYRATFRDEKLTGSGAPAQDRIALTPLEKQLIDAREKALVAFQDARVGLCASASPNFAALPPVTPGGPIIVYMMTPQVDLKAYPLGGHYSVEVNPDGSVGKVRRFTNGCIDMKQDQAPKGAKPAAFFVTHLLDPTPTEIHVFTSLASGLPIIVGTSNKWIWAVDGSNVRTVDKMK